MSKTQLQEDQLKLRTVMELSGGPNLVLPDDMTQAVVLWLKSLTFNGYSDIRIRSRKNKHEVIFHTEAGVIFRGRLAMHEVEAIREALVGY